MFKISKRMQAIKKKLPLGLSPALDALRLLQGLSTVKFVESVDLAVSLGVDPRQTDQAIRGATVLPHGTGKDAYVAVFTQGESVNLAREAGADIVGLEDLAESVKAGNTNFDIVIATPDAMRVVGQLGQILGPRGLMPNPKIGTVTTDVVTAVKNAKAGQVSYRTDKAGIVHCTIGKINFTAEALLENLKAVISDLKKIKPASSKGVYLRKVTVSSTMGPGIVLELSSVES